MKAEFLQNFKVGDAPLPQEVVDAILAENGRDIEAAKKPFADYESLKDQLRTAAEGLKAFEGGGREGPPGPGRQAEAGHGGQGGGAPGPAGRAGLRPYAGGGIKAALEELKKNSGYLFEQEEAPPPYAPGTGTGGRAAAGLDAIRAAAGLTKHKP